MPKSPDVDRYIENALPFAQPILRRIREIMHKAEPDIVESMKWSAPFFEYKGVLANMSAFKQHVRWGFWKAKLMTDPHGFFDTNEESETMGAAKIRDLSEMPDEKVLLAIVREAVKLNETGVKAAPRVKKPVSTDVPDDLEAELATNAAARKAFDAFSPSQRRDYAEWLTEAKQPATRAKRLATAIEWIAEGKPRHWKYARK